MDKLKAKGVLIKRISKNFRLAIEVRLYIAKILKK
jgi:hypothetical protein